MLAPTQVERRGLRRTIERRWPRTKVSPKTHEDVVLEALGELARLDFERARGDSLAGVNASAAFTNDRYDEEPYDEAEGAELSRVHISRTLTGGLEGESTAELMIAKAEGGGGYIGHDRVRGTLNGKYGSFVFQHTGIISPDGVTNAGTIVPGTGTGELEGISGEGTMLADEQGNHTLTLTYELG